MRERCRWLVNHIASWIPSASHHLRLLYFPEVPEESFFGRLRRGCAGDVDAGRVRYSRILPSSEIEPSYISNHPKTLIHHSGLPRRQKTESLSVYTSRRTPEEIEKPFKECRKWLLEVLKHVLPRDAHLRGGFFLSRLRPLFVARWICHVRKKEKDEKSEFEVKSDVWTYDVQIVTLADPIVAAFGDLHQSRFSLCSHDVIGQVDFVCSSLQNQFDVLIARTRAPPDFGHKYDPQRNRSGQPLKLPEGWPPRVGRANDYGNENDCHEAWRGERDREQPPRVTSHNFARLDK
ncbi:hypothetical protein RUM44_010066 [Polyplax serrata]|uniref:Uncharacterized protein n=1 Tax=Polyplax serrata TaxID=468196 RepID=A0ABR1AUS5_POLSC